MNGKGMKKPMPYSPAVYSLATRFVRGMFVSGIKSIPLTLNPMTKIFGVPKREFSTPPGAETGVPFPSASGAAYL